MYNRSVGLEESVLIVVHKLFMNTESLSCLLLTASDLDSCVIRACAWVVGGRGGRVCVCVCVVGQKMVTDACGVGKELCAWWDGVGGGP